MGTLRLVVIVVASTLGGAALAAWWLDRTGPRVVLEPTGPASPEASGDPSKAHLPAPLATKVDRSAPTRGRTAVAALLADQEATQAEGRARIEALARAFREEPVDPAWGPVTEVRLREAMVSDALVLSGVVPDALGYQCRRSLCRVTAAFARHNDAADWAVMLVTAAGPAFATAEPGVRRGPDGTFQLEVYAARP